MGRYNNSGVGNPDTQQYQDMLRITQGAKPFVPDDSGKDNWQLAIENMAAEHVKGYGTDRQVLQLAAGADAQIISGIAVSRYSIQVRGITDTDTVDLWEDAVSAGPIAHLSIQADYGVIVIPGTGAPMSFYLKAKGTNANTVEVCLISRSFGG